MQRPIGEGSFGKVYMAKCEQAEAAEAAAAEP